MAKDKRDIIANIGGMIFISLLTMSAITLNPIVGYPTILYSFIYLWYLNYTYSGDGYE